MGDIRPSIVVAASIPFSILFAFIMMNLFGISANLMSLGGLAIAIGMMVDGTIVMVENVDRMLKESDPMEAPIHVVVRACTEAGRPIIFAVSIIIIVFLPLFTLQGVEGKTFKPLAYTVSLAMPGSLIFAIFLAPVISHIIMKRPKISESGEIPQENFILRNMLSAYRPIVSFFIRFRFMAVGLGILMLIVGCNIGSSQFNQIPHLNCCRVKK